MTPLIPRPSDVTSARAAIRGCEPALDDLLHQFICQRRPVEWDPASTDNRNLYDFECESNSVCTGVGEDSP
ncbi:hypothetical protein EVAR_91215_1 [Eumeta japonica]|uniref:Uncharacterized protein n=1 Tax=Eumeta variegata TaxID=151549 RepID=A0A4C2ADC8_EUMVA|nr:hypothetical protein EVAR_91215_1 [Eumeta japonica]